MPCFGTPFPLTLVSPHTRFPLPHTTMKATLLVLFAASAAAYPQPPLPTASLSTAPAEPIQIGDDCSELPVDFQEACFAEQGFFPPPSPHVTPNPFAFTTDDLAARYIASTVYQTNTITVTSCTPDCHPSTTVTVSTYTTYCPATTTSYPTTSSMSMSTSTSCDTTTTTPTTTECTTSTTTTPTSTTATTCTTSSSSMELVSHRTLLFILVNLFTDATVTTASTRRPKHPAARAPLATQPKRPTTHRPTSRRSQLTQARALGVGVCWPQLAWFLGCCELILLCISASDVFWCLPAA